MHFSLILSPYTFYFATVFLLFLVTASILSIPDPTFPSWHSPSFGGCLGCFGYFLGSGRSTYERNYAGLQDRKIKHSKKHLENCIIIYLIHGPILILYGSLCPGLVCELLDLLLHPNQTVRSAGQCSSLVISFVGHLSMLPGTTVRKSSSTEHTQPVSERSRA